MSHRAILALSAAVSAFVLVLAGAVAVVAWKPAPPAQSAKAGDPVPAEVVRAREAEYQRLLDEANARLRDQEAATVSVAPSEAPRAASEHEREHRREHGREHERGEDDDG
jgi:hypothetical protein